MDDNNIVSFDQVSYESLKIINYRKFLTKYRLTFFYYIFLVFFTVDLFFIILDNIFYLY